VKQTIVLRCPNCESFDSVQLEELRDPTPDERENYPTIKLKEVGQVARCRCEGCGKEGLFVPGADAAPWRAA
jgi:hypothetical protein